MAAKQTQEAGGMNSRQEIFARIRSKISDKSTTPDRAFDVRQRLEKHPAGVVPSGPKSQPARVKRFTKKAKESAASVVLVPRGSEAAAIGDWLRQHNLPQELRMGADRRLARIKWPRSAAPDRHTGPSDGNDLTGLSHALAGINETGTLVLVSGADNPTTLNFLPENHIVILDAGDIVNDHESVWARIRKKFGAGKIPRNINMITGPSRSADIEQTLILGAHGPTRLHIIVVEA
jgi:L-lactate dehydrogenase complex protein LldG